MTPEDFHWMERGSINLTDNTKTKIDVRVVAGSVAAIGGTAYFYVVVPGTAP
jgi:hypothetical protein